MGDDSKKEIKFQKSFPIFQNNRGCELATLFAIDRQGR